MNSLHLDPMDFLRSMEWNGDGAPFHIDIDMTVTITII